MTRLSHHDPSRSGAGGAVSIPAIELGIFSLGKGAASFFPEITPCFGVVQFGFGILFASSNETRKSGRPVGCPIGL